MIEHVRLRAHSSVYAPSMAPPVTGQIVASMKMIMGTLGGDEGERKIRQLHENTRYFRQKVCLGKTYYDLRRR